ncbi:MAG: uracil-DNA glycosylase [Methylotenera sp.]|nr:uracil-DNA glycosylase [Oligoflexia bacterium]
MPKPRSLNSRSPLHAGADFLAKLLNDGLPAGWQQTLQGEAEQPYFEKLSRFVEKEYSKTQVFPVQENLFRALHALDIDAVKIVILGQDPYHGEKQGTGLSFAVPNELFPKPPSLQNIFKELESDLGTVILKEKSDLSGWVDQGVLLLNSVLTVRAAQPHSHRGQGWETFTDHVISRLSDRTDPVVFILWGAAAMKKKTRITNPQHLFLESVHPSPLSASRGFFGSRPFSKSNALLKELGKVPIDWSRTTN